MYVAEKYDGEGAFYKQANRIMSANDALANNAKFIKDAGQQQKNGLL